MYALDHVNTVVYGDRAEATWAIHFRSRTGSISG